jgi:hypothetical protein
VMYRQGIEEDLRSWAPIDVKDKCCYSIRKNKLEIDRN